MPFFKVISQLHSSLVLVIFWCDIEGLTEEEEEVHFYETELAFAAAGTVRLRHRTRVQAGTHMIRSEAQFLIDF